MDHAIDRRAVVRTAAGLATLLFQGAVAPAPTIGVPSIAPPVPRPPAFTAAWVNFEFVISWERMNFLQEIMTNLVDKKITDITLMISSSGGDLAAAISTFNFLRSLGIKLTTYNVGNVDSAAVILFLAGDRRVSEASGQFLLHQPEAGGVAPIESLSNLEDRAQSLRRDTGRFRDILLARTRLARDAADTMLGKATFIDAQRAVDLGLATEVGHLVRPPSMPILTMSQSTFRGPAPAPGPPPPGPAPR